MLNNKKQNGRSRRIPAAPKGMTEGTGKKKRPKSVGEILDTLKKTTQLGQHLEHAEIWSRWPELAGQRLCGHGHPVTIKDNTLHIDAESAVWVHRFGLSKWGIIKRINAMAGKELVSDIYVRLAPDTTPSSPQDDV